MTKPIPPVEFKDKPHKTPAGWWQMTGELTVSPPVTTVVGIDPGVNYGMTIIKGDEVTVTWGKLVSEQTPGVNGLRAYDRIRQVGMAIQTPANAVVEGAAHWYPKGQVQLAEVRWAMYFALNQLGIRVKMMPPASVRLVAFGSGKLTAMDIWPWMNQNAADSIGCAIAAITMED